MVKLLRTQKISWKPFSYKLPYHWNLLEADMPFFTIVQSKFNTFKIEVTTCFNNKLKKHFIVSILSLQ